MRHVGNQWKEGVASTCGGSNETPEQRKNRFMSYASKHKILNRNPTPIYPEASAGNEFHIYAAV